MKLVEFHLAFDTARGEKALATILSPMMKRKAGQLVLDWVASLLLPACRGIPDLVGPPSSREKPQSMGLQRVG